MIFNPKYIIKRLFPKLVLHYKAYKSLISDTESYLYQTGWMKSIEIYKPVDAQGNPQPFMNYSVVSLLNEKLKKDFTLFEYGSGYSTLYFAKKVSTVESVEYDVKWCELIKPELPENTKLHYCKQDKDGNYCRMVKLSGSKYDVIVIDGRDRINCLKQSIDCLSDQGVILLDDSQRERYQSGLKDAQQEGFKVLNIHGLKANDPGSHRTSILYRNNNCFNI